MIWNTFTYNNFQQIFIFVFAPFYKPELSISSTLQSSANYKSFHLIYFKKWINYKKMYTWENRGNVITAIDPIDKPIFLLELSLSKQDNSFILVLIRKGQPFKFHWSRDKIFNGLWIEAESEAK